ncbi:DUF3889 domain-containing protein [Ureibacillus acetophenoni]|uniref:Uncharacterized protein DUF3889 n=1 Tax=Ureibacillus acetophenoni TaxID=614649 RepID=A0A285U6V1_9BACL|nr:DUF3889 domain-containing protein [Ureibacillus acetophenoni]SOC37128.1 uncharacterized protein DUF3889 [Ureibacillus acetophenoni]
MKIMIALLTVGVAFFSIAAFSPMHIVSSPLVQENPTPPYAKWGSLAMQETMKKYPKAQITDYLHIGREVGEKTSVEKFKLILVQDGREFGLFVNLEFTNDTEELQNVTFTETTP